jgi:hypothetical protein
MHHQPHHRHGPPRSSRRAQLGFTLAEVLVAGVLGAILLTAVSDATYSFAMTVAHLEQKAGFADDEDTVMRRLTRDIREAWWADIETSSHLKLQDDEGNYTEYYLKDGDVIMDRSNGGKDTLFEGVSNLVFTATYADRLREGSSQDLIGEWYDHAASSLPALPLPMAVGDALALGLTVPAMDSDVSTIVTTSDEEVMSALLGSISLPLAWIAGTNPENLTIEVFETRGPGMAAPRGPALGSISLPGASLPAAVPSGESLWETPGVDVPINLSNMGGELLPGAGFTVVLTAGGDAQVLLAVHPVLASQATDYLAIKGSAPGSQYVDLPLAVDFKLSGNYSLTSTITTSAVTSVTVVMTPTNRPSKTRSASLLSQTLNKSGWFGSLEDEDAP